MLAVANILSLFLLLSVGLNFYFIVLKKDKKLLYPSNKGFKRYKYLYETIETRASSLYLKDIDTSFTYHYIDLITGEEFSKTFNPDNISKSDSWEAFFKFLNAKNTQYQLTQRDKTETEENI